MAISGSPLRSAFSYHYEGELSIGQRVVVDFAGRNVVGYITSISSKPQFKTKPISRPLEKQVYLTPADITLAKWTVENYLAPIGKVFDLFFPPGKLLKSSSFVIPINSELPFSEPLKMSEALKLMGREQILKLKSQRKLKILHSYEKKLPSKRKVKLLKLSLSIKALEDLNLTTIQKKIIDYLLSVEKATPKEVMEALALKSRSPIETLLRRGTIELEEEEEDRSDSSWTIDAIEDLTSEQESVREAIIKDFKGVHYIFGLTGSGKTEVYFKIMERVLNRGKSVSYMVPEVSLTPQLMARIRGAFPGREVRVYHSYMSPAKRQRIWLDAVNDEIDILVGTRSALWIPIQNTGLIIVDEEHDSSFYQQTPPHYDAVEVAIKKGELYGIPVVLGSATPRVERYFRAKAGEFKLHSLLNRPVGQLPDLEIRDLRNSKDYIIPSETLGEIEKTVKLGHQVFVFVHRKGFSNYVVCANCGNILKCPNCDISLTYHKHDSVLKCHYCGYTTPPPSKCERCGSAALSARGFGTERVEHELQKRFPELSIMRMDRETISNPDQYEKALRKIESKDANIIVGTKMIAKGLDFPNIGLVVVIDADRIINLPNYDSAETAFQIISQISGRSGRGVHGKAIIQTFEPEHRVIKTALENDYMGFFETEVEIRKILKYPPFSTFIEIVVEKEKEEQCEKEAWELFNCIQENIKAAEVLEPVVPAVKKLFGKYRMKIHLKLFDREELEKVLKLLQKNPAGVDILVNSNGGSF
ncbi:primosomal protein N' [Kosmotoga arenicorallina S304]|uniref:Replication restart protein PriA n=1 Tax=Kosmotoga arenicorallina S304 TaxID=1453497 RepID=A0A182C777_9BACT|nr:primosomal protein N' [Kosmotoga arenicorallina]OAA31320.1 primosomal protein N' [Kosmotoga arenicorallina S304]